MIDEAYITKLEDRIPLLEQEMSIPENATDHKKMRKLTQEHSRLRTIVGKAGRVTSLRRELREHRQIMDDSTADQELKELAESEIEDLETKLVDAEKAAMVALLPPNPEEARNAIMEIRAGTGGDEAALFAGDLFRMYTHFAESRGWKIGLIDASASSIGGYKEVVFTVEGEDVYKVLQYESGGHRVQRVPVTETQGRIHTSAATVAVFPEADEIEDDIEFPTEEIRIDIFCASGPGGQSVNTTYSAVRITHLPTGIVAQSQDERSQHRNKAKAMTVLKARVVDAMKQAEADKMASDKRGMIGSGDRSQRVRTYNFPQNRVTDHRIGYTAHNLDRIMEGEISDVLGALHSHDIEERISQAVEDAQ